MTNKLLQELLQRYPDDALVEVETRQKTGDEGDIWQSEIDDAVRHDGSIVISTIMKRLISPNGDMNISNDTKSNLICLLICILEIVLLPALFLCVVKECMWLADIL